MVRLALQIFCRKIEVVHSGALRTRGPMLLVANHPNSFLDAIIIGALFTERVHFLARGDAFHKPWHNRLLRMLNMIPVYRLSEGRENLGLNEHAFARSREILTGGGIVLIFIEGICVHKHELQPFKKGAARIALENRQLPGFTVLPMGIAYDSFEDFGKSVCLHLAGPLPVYSVLPEKPPAQAMREFNEKMFAEIAPRISVPVKINLAPNLLAINVLPVSIGYLLHFPLYSMVKKPIRQKTKGTVFYDSVLFGCLLLLYPLYLVILWLFLLYLNLPFWMVVLLIGAHPLTAWFYVRYKR